MRFASLILGTVFLLGCAGGYSSQDRLQLRVLRFNEAVRWGQFFSAAEFIKSDARSEWLSSHRQWGGDLQIADYEVVDSTLDDDGETAIVRVVISWYRLSQSEVQTTMLAQRWRREGRLWQLISEEVEEGNPVGES